MTFDDAVVALQEAQVADEADAARPLGEASGEPSTPEEAAPVTSDEPAAPAAEDSFVDKADLASLLDGVTDPVARERIERSYKSFQGDYTRKTQALAERSKAYDEFGDPEQVRQALEFQAAVSDPNNWPQLHAELSAELQRRGYTPAQADAEATTQVEEAARPSLPDDLDPDLEPFKAYVENLEGRFDALTDSIQRERATQRQEQEMLAVVGELQRQDNAIRQANPSLTDEDLTEIYQMSSFFGGNLFQAKEHLDARDQRRLQAYVDGKGAVQDTPGIHPVSGAETISSETRTPEQMTDKEIDALAKQVIDESGALHSL